MRFICTALVLAVILSAEATPLFKRGSVTNDINNTPLPRWNQTCYAAGGGSQCNNYTMDAFESLRDRHVICEHQDATDGMIELAKTLHNNAEMICLAKLFRQQPHDSPDGNSFPYCQIKPRNSELNGLFQCQFQSVNDSKFTIETDVDGNVTTLTLTPGQRGAAPFNITSPLPLGACPANPGGKIPDGTAIPGTCP